MPPQKNSDSHFLDRGDELGLSFDSILSALALTKVFAVMALAIIISGAMMVVMADRVAIFLERTGAGEGALRLFLLAYCRQRRWTLGAS